MKKSEIIENIFSLYEIAKNGKQIYDAPSGDGWAYWYVFQTVTNSYNRMAKTPMKCGWVNYDEDPELTMKYFTRHNKEWLENYKLILTVTIDKMNGKMRG
jgi:Fe-S cluster biosynthesis and repair protein YggX